jgi:hypothetical protein
MTPHGHFEHHKNNPFLVFGTPQLVATLLTFLNSVEGIGPGARLQVLSHDATW